LSLKTKTMEKAYIATEPGYRLSYHGASSISFPSGTWGEMIESKRDKGAAMTSLASFAPERAPGYEVEIENITELSLEEWYYIKKAGTKIKAKHSSGFWYDTWGMEQPYFDKNEASSYGIYTPAHGLIYDDGWNYIEKVFGDYYNLWRFSGSGSGISIRNYAPKYNNQASYDIVKFPAVLRTLDNNIEPKITGNREDDIKVTFTEINTNLFSSEKKYRIKHPNGQVLKDYVGYGEWKIYPEGRFYRIISTGNNLLYGHKVENIISSDEWSAKTEKCPVFPARGTTTESRDHYFRRVWNISETSVKGRFVIQNLMYVHHYLYLKNNDNNNMDLTRDNPLSGNKGVFIIEEIN